MIFKPKTHNHDLYNILLTLSRSIFFYKNIGLADTFETRIYLMFIHFSILMIITKKKGNKFDQDLYDFKFVRGLKNTNGQMSLGVSGGFDDSNDHKISYKYRIFF